MTYGTQSDLEREHKLLAENKARAERMNALLAEITQGLTETKDLSKRLGESKTHSEELQTRIDNGITNLGRTQLVKADKVARGVNAHAQGHKFGSCVPVLGHYCQACAQKKEESKQTM